MASAVDSGKAAQGVFNRAAAREMRLVANCAGPGAALRGHAESLLSRILGMTPRGVVWWTMSERLQPEKLRFGRSLRALVERAAIDWIDGKPEDGPTHRLTLVAKAAKQPVARLRVTTFAPSAVEADGRLVLQTDLPIAWLSDSANVWLAAVVRSAAPSWARIDGARSSDAGTTPRAGWLTYLSRSLGPLPAIPPPTQVVPVDDLGWILVAQPEPVDEAKPEHQASLAYVRHALGARVLRDGPAFPPPAVAEAVAAAVTLKEPDSVVAEVPSYLKVPPVVAELTPAPVMVAPAPPAAAPFVAVTVDIDLAQILKSSVPFDSEAAPPTLPVTAQPAGQSRVPTAGETKELDVFESVKRDPAVPFGGPAAGAAARGAATERPSTELPAAPQGKRWKLFDPQTGRPLAGPVLEAIPPAPRATPSGVPAETIGSPAVLAGATGMLGDRKPDGYTETLELDPALLAAVLKKPAAPFRR